MAGAVSNCFLKLTNTTRHVTQLEQTNIERIMLSVATWEEFRDWIYGIVTLLNTHQLSKFWDKGYIVGFLGKEEAKVALKGEQAGVFLVRFSDCIKSGPGISIDYSTGHEEEAEVKSIILTEAELREQSLAERICGMEFLSSVYSGVENDPDGDGITQKEDAFFIGGDQVDAGQSTKKNEQLTPEMMEELKGEFESFLKEVLVLRTAGIKN